MKTFEDRVEEVLGELHGMAWPLLEEHQKRKITAKVAAGIEKGDTQAAWSRALRVSTSELSRRLQRFRRSEPIDPPSAGRLTDSELGTIRSAKSLMARKPIAAQQLVDPVAKAVGQTRQAAPSNKARVEQAFGPTEFNRLEDAIENLYERLPDLAPNREDKKYAADLADKCESAAQVLRGWARGESIGEEAAAWLSEQ